MRAALWIALLGVCVAAAAGLIISVDVGSDSMKIALVKPGLPFHIVTNPQSKRKTSPAITIHDGERFFGADAMGLQTRKPESTFVGVHRLLGRGDGHSLAQAYLGEDQYIAHGTSVNARGGFDVSYPAPQVDADSADAATPRNSSTFVLPSKYSVEEISAMVLAHGREFSETVAEGKIKDAVFTVPAFFTQNERLALIDAAELAGLNVLAMVDENFAAGVRYSIDYLYNETTNVLVYNMGAAHTQVSIHRHSAYVLREGGANRTFTQFAVVGKGWDANLGGATFEDVLIARFAEAFNKGKHLPDGQDVRSLPRAMAKLRKNVQRVKEILSVNEEYPMMVEALAADVDFKMPFNRSAMEAWTAGVLARVLLPIEAALADANLTKADIHGVELIGGGVRMPSVQALLVSYFAPLPVGQHLNGDEAMSLGGAFVAANRSSAYRVKKIGALDITSFSVAVNISSNSETAMEEAAVPTAPAGLAAAVAAADAAPVAEGSAAASAAAPAVSEYGEGEDAEEVSAPAATGAAAGPPKPWAKRSLIFPVHTLLGTTKKIAFRHPHDVSAVLYHDPSGSQRLPTGSSRVLARLNITGVEDVVKGPKGHLGVPKVVLSFTCDHNGLYSLKHAEAQLEESLEVPVPTPKPTPTPKPKPSPKAKKGAAANATAANATTDNTTLPTSTDADAPTQPMSTPLPDTAAADNATAAVDASNSTAANSTAPAPPKMMWKKFLRRFPLKVTVDTSSLGVQPLTVKQKNASKTTLKRIQQLDDERHAREAAKNAVEAFMYTARNKLSDHEEELKTLSTEEQRGAVLAMCEEVEEWLYEEGESTTMQAYTQKLAEMHTVADVVLVPLHLFLNPTPTPTPVPEPAALNGTEEAAAGNATLSEEEQELADEAEGVAADEDAEAGSDSKADAEDDGRADL